MIKKIISVTLILSIFFIFPGSTHAGNLEDVLSRYSNEKLLVWLYMIESYRAFRTRDRISKDITIGEIVNELENRHLNIQNHPTLKSVEYDKVYINKVSENELQAQMSFVDKQLQSIHHKSDTKPLTRKDSVKALTYSIVRRVLLIELSKR